MSPEKQRIAIAEHCGFVWYRIPILNLRSLFHPSAHEYEGQDPRWMVRADGTEPIANDRYMTNDGHVPDYLNDLNAMHEAEKVIDAKGRWLDYAHALAALTSPAQNNPYRSTLNWTIVWTILSATASQRAEAFLRTVGKWEES